MDQVRPPESDRLGTQYLIDEDDLDWLTSPFPLSLPASWQRAATVEPMPDVLAAIRSSRIAR